MDLKHVAKDVHNCLRTISKFTENQAIVLDFDSDFLKEITVQIQPNSGPYFGGKFVFKICFNDNYPSKPPEVLCLTNIYHPNIDVYDKGVCINILDEDWKSHYGLEDVIQGLIFLLNYPNLEDPLSCWFEPNMDENDFHDKIKHTLQGQSIDEDKNIVFPVMIETTHQDNCSQTASQNNETDKIVTDSNFEKINAIQRTNSIQHELNGHDSNEPVQTKPAVHSFNCDTNQFKEGMFTYFLEFAALQQHYFSTVCLMGCFLSSLISWSLFLFAFASSCSAKQNKVKDKDKNG